MRKKSKAFDDLERLAMLAPVALYWTDENAVVLGMNEFGIKIGKDLYAQKDIIGKFPTEVYPEKVAKMIYDHTMIVINTGQTHSFEEIVPDVMTGRIRYYTATRAPLFDGSKVIGIIGTVVEITAEKEATRLQLEIERQKAHIEEQEKFVEVASQVSHDMRSPVGGLDCAVREAKEYLPEDLRTRFNVSITKLRNIVGYLTSFRRKQLLERQDLEQSQELSQIKVQEQKQEVILQLELLQALAEKGYLHGNDIRLLSKLILPIPYCK